MPIDTPLALFGTPARRALAYHALASLGVVVVVAVLTTVLTGRLAEQEAIRDARSIGQSLGSGLVGPLVTAEVRDGDAAAIKTLDSVVQYRIRSSRLIERVKVWDADGTVIYSDATALIGRRFQLAPDDLKVLAEGGVDSDVSDGTRPENVEERGLGRMVEVYSRTTDQTGRVILVETYFSVANLEQRSGELRRHILPLFLLALGLMQLLLLPLSVWLARRAERSERERLVAQREAIESATVERRRLGGELHDGVIQDLAAVGYALSTVSNGLRRLDDPSLAATVERTIDVVRTDIATLRQLTSRMYSSQERDIDLAAAVLALIQEMAVSGATGEVGEIPQLPVTTASAVFQVAREAMRNAVRHAGSPPHLTLKVDAGQLLLSIVDRGAGYQPGSVDGPTQGHLGLSLLRDAADRAGGELEVRTMPGAGTQVLLNVDLATMGARPAGMQTAESYYRSPVHNPRGG